MSNSGSESQSKSATITNNVPNHTNNEQNNTSQREPSSGSPIHQKPVCCGCIQFSNSSKVIKLEPKRSVSSGVINIPKKQGTSDSPKNSPSNDQTDISKTSKQEETETHPKPRSPNEHRKLKRPSNSFDYGQFPSSRQLRLAPEPPPTSVDDSQLQKRKSEPSMNGNTDYNSDSSANSPRPGTSPSSSKEKKSWLRFGKKKQSDSLDPYYKKKKPFVLRMSSELMRWNEIRKRTAEEGSYCLVNAVLEESAIRVPKLKVTPISIEKPLYTYWGPRKTERVHEPHYHKTIYGKSISTYPMGKEGVKLGDPVCDRFFFQMHHNRVIAALADGCNWGKKPQQAAKRATSSFVHFLDRQQIRIKHTKDAAEFVMKGFEKAHFNIIEGKPHPTECGTTTLIGGVLLEVKKEASKRKDSSETHSEEESDSNNNNAWTKTKPTALRNNLWMFICASVGDSKAFHYSPSTGSLVDVTSGNRTALLDATDPGGRLGPYPHKSATNNNSWDPDLSNFQLFWTFCKEEDYIMLVSDGVHDNFDPQTLGFDPKEIGLDVPTWEAAEKQFPDKLDILKADFRSKMILDKIIAPLGENLSPESIAAALLEHCRITTEKARVYMEATGARQPSDKKEYPGKMDHSTCLIIKVGHNTHIVPNSM